jgi:predicted tellurium resistance membrane protein TerC
MRSRDAPLPRAAGALRWLTRVLRSGFFVRFFALDFALAAILVSVGVKMLYASWGRATF